jgi:glycosyltransferase involved in cell wall biosynthesis
MIPRYVCWSGPAATLRRKPVVFWYVHRRDSLELRLACRFSRVVATAVQASFPFATPKLRPLGHGINSDVFVPESGSRETPGLVVMVGRLMPVKRQATLIRAIAELGPSRRVDVRVVGGVPQGEDPSYAESLRALARTLGVEQSVTFAGMLDTTSVRDLYRRAAVAVNLSPAGLFDKSAIESMMAGAPTIVASALFDDLLPAHLSWLRLDTPDDPAKLAGTLNRLLEHSVDERRRMGRELSGRAVAAHNLDGFMDRLVALLSQAAAGAP